MNAPTRLLRRYALPDDKRTLLQQLDAASIADETVAGRIQEMAHAIAARGDSAVAEFSQRFDGVDTGTGVLVSEDELRCAADAVPRETLDAIAFAHERLVAFHKRSAPRTWDMREGDSTLGQRVTPIRRVGVYAPGGKAAYVSTVLMDVVPAQVAGCREIALCSSPKPEFDGGITPVILAACHLLGITEVYRMGGAQAVLAMAIGTGQVPKVDMICGPGNVWVTEAKRWAQGTGRVKIDKLAGPTEVLIIADDSADPRIVAADLIAQAEHDEDARPILVTTHEPLIDPVEAALHQQLADLPKREIALAALSNHGFAVTAPTLDEACEISNAVAPEHLEVLTREPESLLDQLVDAGAIFLGPYTPEAIGDYTAGPNHVLPTVGTARFSSPLLVDDFVKVTSVLNVGPETLRGLADATTRLARAEGLEGHARSVDIRLR